MGGHMPIVEVQMTAGTLSRGGKQYLAQSMYFKGKSFIHTALLATRQVSSEQFHYVALHLFCQGIECTLKGLLLFRDYDRFIIQLRPLGHDLVQVAKETAKLYGLNSLRGDLEADITILSNLYSKHFLRYGELPDIFINPMNILRNRALRRIGAVIRLAERELKRAQIP
jgi:hypothetical protein